MIFVQNAHTGVGDFLISSIIKKTKEGLSFAMDYYIDFEATQGSSQIIEIGCVSASGRIFSSLVRPQNMKDVTGFITGLTGIRRDMLKNAKDAEQVFEEFLIWMSDDGDDARFFVYGDMDYYMLKQTARECKSFAVISGILGIAYHLYDVHEDVGKVFDDNKAPSLSACYKALGLPMDKIAPHHALDDARMLKAICQHEKVAPNISWINHMDMKDKITKRQAVRKAEKRRERKIRIALETKIPKITDIKNLKGTDYSIQDISQYFRGKNIVAISGTETKRFSGIIPAMKWVEQRFVSQSVGEEISKTKSNVIIRKIFWSIAHEREYCGFIWSEEQAPRGGEGR